MMRKDWTLVNKKPVTILILFLITTLFSVTVLSQEFNPLQMFGQKKKAYIEPDGYYRAVFPAGFHCNAKKKHFVRCYGNRKNHGAYFEISVKDVPKSANSAVVALREMKNYKTLEHFHLISQSKMMMNSLPGVNFVYSYDQLGNVQYAMGVRSFFWVKSGKLITIHFKARLRAFKVYDKDLRVFFENFYPASINKDGRPNWRELGMEKKKRSEEKAQSFGRL